MNPTDTIGFPVTGFGKTFLVTHWSHRLMKILTVWSGMKEYRRLILNEREKGVHELLFLI